MKKSKNDRESILTDCSMIVLLKIWVILPSVLGYEPQLYAQISESEIKEALKRMKSRKVVGMDGIPIEVWRYLGEMGVRWLTNLFNKI